MGYQYGCPSQPPPLRHLTVLPVLPAIAPRRSGQLTASLLVESVEETQTDIPAGSLVSELETESTLRATAAAVVATATCSPVSAITFHLPVPAFLSSAVLFLRSVYRGLHPAELGIAGPAGGLPFLFVGGLVVLLCVMQPLMLIVGGLIITAVALASTLRVEGAPAEAPPTSRALPLVSPKPDHKRPLPPQLDQVGASLIKLQHLSQTPLSPTPTATCLAELQMSGSTPPKLTTVSPSMPMPADQRMMVRLTPAVLDQHNKPSQNSPLSKPELTSADCARPSSPVVPSSSVVPTSASSAAFRNSPFQSGLNFSPFESTTHPFHQGRTALVGWLDHEMRNSLHAILAMVDTLQQLQNQPGRLGNASTTPDSSTSLESPPKSDSPNRCETSSNRSRSASPDGSGSEGPSSGAERESSSISPPCGPDSVIDSSEECLSVIRDSALQIQQVLIELQLVSQQHLMSTPYPNGLSPAITVSTVTSVRPSTRTSCTSTPNSHAADQSQQHASQPLHQLPSHLVSAPPTPKQQLLPMLSHSDVQVQESVDYFEWVRRQQQQEACPYPILPQESIHPRLRTPIQPLSLQWPPHQHSITSASSPRHVPAVVVPSEATTVVTPVLPILADQGGSFSSPSGARVTAYDVVPSSADAAYNWLQGSHDGTAFELVKQPLPILNPQVPTVQRMRSGNLSMPSTPMQGSRQLHPRAAQVSHARIHPTRSY